MIRIRYTRHSRGRRAERHVEEADIVDAINNPVMTTPGNESGRRKAHGRVLDDGTQVVVVTSWPPDGTDTVWVVTVYLRSICT